ncbi:MAG TPA: hypothetical protein VLS90_07685 [Thermodesulfobacteriota bacterium]|nr:hypothetical protein [Thermodesulfobacteriota bacterium]
MTYYADAAREFKVNYSAHALGVSLGDNRPCSGLEKTGSNLDIMRIDGIDAHHDHAFDITANPKEISGFFTDHNPRGARRS